ncbi:MAG: hypothetical protein WCQ99_05930 [Pseudomonadota bacterium]
MLNKKKYIGMILACIGVGIARIDSFLEINDQIFFTSKALGIFIAFAGLATFSSGLKKTIKKVRACPYCFKKNDLAADICKKCKKALL